MTLQDAAKLGYIIHGPAYFENFKEYHKCGRKIRHNNFLTALRHAMSLRGTPNSKHIQIYACTYCEGLHIGNGYGRDKVTK